MTKSRRILLSLLIAVIIGLATSSLTITSVTLAQPGSLSDDLLKILALVPDSEYARADFVSYINYRAVEAAGNGISPQNFAAFEALDSTERRIWLQTNRRVLSGPYIWSHFMSFGTMPEVVGFDVFDIDEGLSFGAPPQQGMILAGDFNIDAFEAAHTARDYEQAEIAGVTAWCSPDGCETGLQHDLRERDPANIFDPGALGRRPPIVVLPGYFLSAFDYDVITGMAEAAAGDTSTLADAPDYRTLTEAVTNAENYSGTLVQVQFIHGVQVQNVADYTQFETREDYTEFLETVNDPFLFPPLLDEWQIYSELPPYSMIALADRQEGDMQVAIVALLYPDEESAQAAAAELTTRIANFANEMFTRQSEPLLNRVEDAQVNEPYIYTSEATGLSAAIASVSYPLPPEDDTDSTPGTVFRFWINAIIQRSFYPVWQINLPDWAFEEE